VSAAASPPVGSPPQYSPALRWVTTGFGMGPGGASTLSATGTPHPQHAGGRDPDLLRHAPARSRPAPGGSPTRPAWPHHGPSRIRPARSAHRLRPGRSSHLPLARAAPLPRNDPGWVLLQGVRPRPLGRLGSSRLPAVHLPPINPVICRGSYLTKSGDARLGEGFPLRCFQRFARPHVATQRCRSRDNWRTSGASTPVLSY
jgi:hypothetical protein